MSTSQKRIVESALALISKRGGAGVTMGEIAAAARISRQAVYLQYPDPAALLISLARYAGEKRGLAQQLRKVTEAPTGIAALREFAALQARMNPGIWTIARAFGRCTENRPGRRTFLAGPPAEPLERYRDRITAVLLATLTVPPMA